MTRTLTSEPDRAGRQLLIALLRCGHAALNRLSRSDTSAEAETGEQEEGSHLAPVMSFAAETGVIYLFIF